MTSHSDNQWSIQVEIHEESTQILFTTEAFSVICPLLPATRPWFQDVIQGVRSCVSWSSPATSQERKPFTIPLRNVLWAELGDDAYVTIAVLAETGKNHELTHYNGKVISDLAQAKQWVSRLIELAYDGVPPRRNVKVLVNPKGGQGRAKKIYEKIVRPMLESARCVIDTQYTTHRFHAMEIAETISLDCDAIVALSGDGLPHEILNGLASRPDAIKALRIPVVPVPSGSANGFSLNLHGLKAGFDVALAVLNVIKGKPMRLDLCSVTQGGRRTWSYFSQSFGFMADIDLGTEFLRWMGDTRFYLGFLYGLISNKPYPFKLFIKSAISDKKDLLALTREPPSKELFKENLVESLPADRYISESTSDTGWVSFDKPILYVYAGLQPYVARDLLQFPMAKPSDGYVDIAIQEVASRAALLSMVDEAGRGGQFYQDTSHYYKALAYRLEPYPNSKGVFSVDGEVYPWEPIYIEAHQGLATTLSMHGHFVVTFVDKPSSFV